MVWFYAWANLCCCLSDLCKQYLPWKWLKLARNKNNLSNIHRWNRTTLLKLFKSFSVEDLLLVLFGFQMKKGLSYFFVPYQTKTLIELESTSLHRKYQFVQNLLSHFAPELTKKLKPQHKNNFKLGLESILPNFVNQRFFSFLAVKHGRFTVKALFSYVTNSQT